MLLRNRKVVGTNTKYEVKPKLRRSGSSGISLTSSSTSFEDEDEEGVENDTTDELSLSSSFSSSDFFKGHRNDPFVAVDSQQQQQQFKQLGPIQTQVTGLVTNFTWNGLPWEGEQCRSVKAGLSGIFFALTALFCPDDPWEQAWWIFQAFTSIMADYFYIHTRSVWHGIDRIMAQTSLIYLVVRGMYYVHPLRALAMPGLAVGTFILANRAKNREDIQQWHWCHLAWHIVGPTMTCLGMYLSKTCPPNESSSDAIYFRQFCKY